MVNIGQIMANDIELTVATWNLSSCLLRDRDHSLPPNVEPGEAYVKERLAIYQPCVVGLQEVSFPNDRPSQAHRLREKLGYVAHAEWQLSPSHLIPGEDLGIAILSRYPIERTEKFLLPNLQLSNEAGEASHEKGILGALLNVDGQKVWFFCGHLLPLHRFGVKLSDPRTAEIFTSAEDAFLSASDAPAVCGVDLNAELDATQLPRVFGDRRLRKLIRQPTRPEGAINDQLLCSRHWQTEWVQVYRSRLDHHLCVARLQLLQDAQAETRHTETSASNRIRLLHLSDLHFGERSKEDVEWKTFISTMQHETRKDRLKSILGELDQVPDYVIISGDLTIAGRKDGFKSTVELLDWMENQLGLSRDAIVAVPGNHDVTRASGLPEVVDAEARWKNYHRFMGERCVRPWLPSHDPDQSTILSNLQTALESAEHSRLWGAFAHDVVDESGACLPFPFVFDRDRNLLIYAFNSASVSGSHIEIDANTRAAVESLRSARSKYKKDFEAVLKAYEGELSIDPARIQPEELGLFHGIMNMLRGFAGDELEDALKVAVLHHHVVPLPIEEVKKFDVPTNAGRFVKELTEAAFHMILHGHKHYPEPFSSGTSLNDQAQLVLSGGTIGGGEATGKSAGFYVVDYDISARLVEASFVVLEPQGNPKSIVENARRHPGIVVPRSGGFDRSVRGPRSLDIAKMFRDSENALMRYVRGMESDRDTSWAGWSHELDEDRVSTVATAYGLRILHMTGALRQGARQVVDDAVTTLLEMRSTVDGGWSASSQMAEDSQLEPTAFVILGLRHWVNSATLIELGGTLESLLGDEDAPIQPSYLFTLCLVAEALRAAKPDSPRLSQIIDTIESSAYVSEDGHYLHWPRRAITEEGESHVQAGREPSVLHSAMAILALRRAYDDTDGQLGADAASVEQALRWLARRDTWADTTEDINRKYGTKYCNLVVKHFTKTWVARALLTSNEFAIRPRLGKCVDELAESNEQGLWNWGDLQRPIWATHDALSTISAYALATAET